MPNEEKPSLWRRWNEEGILVPLAKDAANGKPSVTLLGVYVALLLSAGSLVGLHFFKEIETATITCLGFYTLASVLYLLRNLQKAKFSVKEQALELDSDDDEVKK